jgi:hypothetical protein
MFNYKLYAQGGFHPRRCEKIRTQVPSPDRSAQGWYEGTGTVPPIPASRISYLSKKRSSTEQNRAKKISCITHKIDGQDFPGCFIRITLNNHSKKNAVSQ